MPTPQETLTARVAVAEDRSAASLIIPADLPREQITVGFCKVLLKDRGVECSPAVMQAIMQLISDPPPAGQTVEAPIAHATEPVDGVGGRVEWLVETPAESSEEPVNFYARSPYAMVQAGQIIGRRHEPTAGADGRDVLGATRRARPGKAAPWTFDQSILVNGRGDIVAQAAGMLGRAGGKAWISQVLQVDDAVDFSTGHIDFDGDVVIARGVRDRFEVKATGSVEIRGLVEAASLTCGHNLLALGGMAGRDRGAVTVGGDFAARYLDGVRGEIGGDLCVDREIINSDLTVEGDVRMARGAIICGRMVIGGRVEARALGCPASTPTHLVLGGTPSIERAIGKLDQIVQHASQRRAALVQEQQSLLDPGRRLTAQDCERQTEIHYQLQRLDQVLAKAEPGRVRLEQTLAHRRIVDVRVSEMIYRGVTFEVGGQRYTLGEDTRGPVRLTANDAGTPLYQQGSGPPRPLAELGAVRVAA